MRSWITPKVVFPLIENVTRHRFRSDLAHQREALRYVAAKLESQPLARIRELVRHAVENVPFCRDLCGKAGAKRGMLGTFLRGPTDATPCLKELQLQAEDAETYSLRFVPTDRFTRAYGETLEAALPELFGPGIAVRVEAVDRLTPEPSGKRLIIRRAGAPAEAE